MCGQGHADNFVYYTLAIQYILWIGRQILFNSSKSWGKLGMLSHIYNPSIHESDAGPGQAQGQFELHSENVISK